MLTRLHGRKRALVHGSTPDSQFSQRAAASPTDRRRLRPAQRGHPIQDTARKARLDVPASSTPGAKAIANDGLVAEEDVLHTGLSMVTRGLLPLPPPERFHVGDRAIPSTRARAAARHLRRPGQRHDHLRVSRARGLLVQERVRLTARPGSEQVTAVTEAAASVRRMARQRHQRLSD